MHATPIVTRGGEILGVLSVHFDEPRRPSMAEMQVADLCARHAADVIESSRADAVLRQTLSELRASQESLRAADRSKDEFLATLAHELRNPLAPIRTALQVLRLSRDEPVVERVHAMMERQVAHVVRLVEDLTEVSRVTRGKIALCRRRLSLEDLVQGAIETSRPLLEAAHHRLHVSMPPQPVPLDADPVRIVQVLSNLLNNAARYTDPGGNVWIEARRDGDHAVVAVRDDGMGIAPDALPRIFELFAQGERAERRRQGGLGIGLTIARSMVALHGGTVEAFSAGQGRGAEFRVRLPLASGDGASPEDSTSDGAHGVLPALRVLVAEDEDDARESLGILLRLLGADVHLVADGSSALEAIPRFAPDLVVLDLAMPGLDGREVARRIRSPSGARGPMLAALTGWGSERDRASTRDAGFDHHLVKPVELRELSAVLAAAERQDTRGERPEA